MFLSEFAHNIHSDRKIHLDVMDSAIKEANKEYIAHKCAYIEHQIARGLLDIIKEMVSGDYHNVLIDKPVVETQELDDGATRMRVKIAYKLIAASGTQFDFINTWRSKGIKYSGYDPYKYPYNIFRKGVDK